MKSPVSSTPISESNCSCFGADKCREHRFPQINFSYKVMPSGRLRAISKIQISLNGKELAEVLDVQISESK